MKKLRVACMSLVLVTACMLAAPAFAKPGMIRVLLLDGQSAGAYHDWQVTTPILKKELEESGIFEVTVATSPQAGGDFSSFHPKFSEYKVVVSNLDAPAWPPELRSQMEQYVQRGGGLVVVHAADNAFPDWPGFNRMIGVGGWRGRDEKAGPRWYLDGSRLVSDPSPGPAGSHGARLPFQVTTRQPQHPIMKGLPPVWMHGPDELYAGLRGPGEQMTVLATAHSDPLNKGTGRDEPILMVVRDGQGRIFHTTLGHDAAALSCVGFITTLQRGTEWAATGKVTQKVPALFPSAETSSLRVDLAEMDPAYLKPPSAGSFDGYADIALAAMRQRADELKISGVAVFASFDGDHIESWRSKMSVVGHLTTPASATDKGANLLAIAYSKASEMADTLKDSGSHTRPPMTGEFGWQGGVIVQGKHGYVIAAFSGGKSEDDVEVSRAGAEKVRADF